MLDLGDFDIKVELKVKRWTQTCCMLLKAECTSMKQDLYGNKSSCVFWLDLQKIVQTRAGSKNRVMVKKIHICALISEQWRHNNKTRWLLRKNPEHSFHNTHSLGYTLHCYGHILYTNTHDRASRLPESRVSPQPPVWAPDVRSYVFPTFPGPERSAGADPDPTNATPRPHTDARGHPDLAAGHKSTYT